MGEEGRGETGKSGFQDRCLKPLGHPSLKPVLCQIVQRPSSVTRAARSLLSRWTLFLQIVLRLPGAPDGCALNPLADEMDQLLLGLLIMMAISSPQYVWTLF